LFSGFQTSEGFSLSKVRSAGTTNFSFSHYIGIALICQDISETKIQKSSRSRLAKDGRIGYNREKAAAGFLI
jgi:hypothetical protein